MNNEKLTNYYGRPKLAPGHKPEPKQVINNISAQRFPLETFVYREYLFQIMCFEHGINSKIMKAIINLLLIASNQYSKLLVVRVDIRVYSETPNNNVISAFRKTLLRYLDTQYNSKVWFLWVREQAPRNDKAHYHCIIILNGHKTRSGWGVFQQVKKACYMNPNTSPWLPKSATYLIKRCTPESFQLPIHRASYLAKNYSKESNPRGIKRYQSSCSRPN
ncbi:YagK/YfjJ domain-containing protein [Shewanella nanhaiensis]|uniref:Inovirus Gp2 family protein n=1 Tax=Shewanella nanhaiensis TaxID=2864872 RepID=A0ABS7EA65_9GAMM|nr:inovirus-type Gp2 protein [Shewanella nanhaiensis]MBW8186578.1 inovirus Gp2 family protein [Shewanella nanhaiensis]